MNSVLTGVLVVASCVVGWIDEPITREIIWQRFQERQGAASTVHVVFTEQRLLSAEFVSPYRDRAQGDATKKATRSGHNEDMLVRTSLGELWISGDQVRVDKEVLSLRHDSFGDRMPGKSAFDGTEQRNLTGADTHPDHTPEATATRERHSVDWKLLNLRPFFYAFRPVRAELFGQTPQEWELDVQPVVVGDHECVTLIGRPPGISDNKAWDYRVYLDRHRDFVPLRIVSEPENGSKAQVDIQYERTQDPTWCPSGWRIAIYKPNSTDVDVASEYTITDVELGSPIPDSTFKIEFPSGSRVIDMRDGDRKVFNVQGDGTWRKYGQTGGSLVPWMTWSRMGGVLLLILLIFGLFWIRRRVA